jgi:hypothetical protein
MFNVPPLPFLVFCQPRIKIFIQIPPLIKILPNIDGLVKSRHPGESRGPGGL